MRREEFNVNEKNVISKNLTFHLVDAVAAVGNSHRTEEVNLRAYKNYR